MLQGSWHGIQKNLLYDRMVTYLHLRPNDITLSRLLFTGPRKHNCRPSLMVKNWSYHFKTSLIIQVSSCHKGEKLNKGILISHHRLLNMSLVLSLVINYVTKSEIYYNRICNVNAVNTNRIALSSSTIIHVRQNNQTCGLGLSQINASSSCQIFIVVGDCTHTPLQVIQVRVRRCTCAYMYSALS